MSHRVFPWVCFLAEKIDFRGTSEGLKGYYFEMKRAITGHTHNE